MRLTSFTRGTIGVLALGGIVWGCSSRASDCHYNKNCGPYDGDAAGTSGSSGSSGKGGTAGKSGSSGGGAAGVGNEAGSGGDEAGASGVGGSSGTSGNAGSGGAPCVGTSTPDTAQCVIGDEYGVFVSLSGNDMTGDGTEAKPLATVTKALTLTGPGKINRLYVCSTPNGSTTSYAEPDTLTIPDRVSIYGGFTCANGVWEYDTTVKAWLKPVSPVGAIVSNTQNGVTVQDLRIDAMDAASDGTGASSFGMIVKGSKGVVLTRTEVHAGKGGGGAAGLNGATGADGDAPTSAQNGADYRCSGTMPQTGGTASLQSSCGTFGGNGGTGYLAIAGGPGLPGTPNDHLTLPGQGVGGPGATMSGSAYFGMPGTPGSSGNGGNPGAKAPLGFFSATGYTVANGGAGSDGFPGQGGGGGGASMGSGANTPPGTCFGASGGAGGMGGCGGQAGTGGVGGGASVALLSWNSTLTLNASTLVAKSGGAGGNGGKGHAGGAGKAGGSGGAGNTTNQIAKAGNGGDGGDGGNGGNGAGGSGGPSLALVYSGTKPIEVADPVLIHSDTGAPAGSGGQLGAQGAWGPNGTTGLAQSEYEQP
jgi:hypothetical protein